MSELAIIGYAIIGVMGGACFGGWISFGLECLPNEPPSSSMYVTRACACIGGVSGALAGFIVSH